MSSLWHAGVASKQLYAIWSINRQRGFTESCGTSLGMSNDFRAFFREQWYQMLGAVRSQLW